MIPSPVKQDEKPQSYAGIHLSGVSANRTSIAIVRGRILESPLRIMKVYERIGSFGSLFSDERLLDVLTHAGPFAEVFIDCPLSVPPCVACARPTCPGVVSCEDLAVAYMLRANERLRRRGAAKSRPLNPQSQRLWDVYQLESRPEGDRPEPSYSANLAPLVTRALTLQKRLRGAALDTQLRETSIPHAIQELASSLGLAPRVFQTYRRFEGGQKVRLRLLEQLIVHGWLQMDFDLREARPGDDPPTVEQIAQTPETFHAVMAALVAAMHHMGMTQPPPPHFGGQEGWVYIPSLSSTILES
jgi:hypothetical protein